MKHWIFVVGHRPPRWVRDGYDEYVKRLPKGIRLEIFEIKPVLRTRSCSVEKNCIEEGERILRALPADVHIIALDFQGKDLDTGGLASYIAQWQKDGIDVAWIIGGADGLSPAVRRHAHEVIRLSALTLPHDLVRVVLAEALYRASSYLQGHPYHRA